MCLTLTGVVELWSLNGCDCLSGVCGMDRSGSGVVDLGIRLRSGSGLLDRDLVGS